MGEEALHTGGIQTVPGPFVRRRKETSHDERLFVLKGYVGLLGNDQLRWRDFQSIILHPIDDSRWGIGPSVQECTAIWSKLLTTVSEGGLLFGAG